ncbi:DUF1361 domain-containing protein [Enterococcus pallens]|uniref:DUF1361 domain-containing protein n=1 Tax=Enterococcus pallens ATCC BAA-351 TaxID=1158607 RepID=R2Q5P6_9ENTE|nr:DUF1361 domain-containing protein [Enterococcus pallens]EOH91857.1 hypothetical protein UAU_03159 [Enterococcus pallens ATCC BAA-351]EOU25285.1 hypothetical protein I588_01273 [Enterococcus pallens ATCC BAA-351]OJG79913.1 hypothetical protein RV10_GL004983 [Enterococcus pallens]
MALMLFITIIFNLFALLLIIIRPKIFQTKLFRPMIYNFKLSVIPIFILLGTLALQLFFGWLSAVTSFELLGVISSLILIIGLLVWLIFLPNAGYLVTELNLTHREMDKIEVPIWYDIIAVLSLAISGVLNTALNIVLLQFTFIIYLDPDTITSINTPLFWVLTWLVFPVLSFGIYLGRYIRFYTWDLFHPIQFMQKLLKHFREKNHRRDAILFTLLYGIFFALFYAVTFLNPLWQMVR